MDIWRISTDIFISFFKSVYLFNKFAAVCTQYLAPADLPNILAEGVKY